MFALERKWADLTPFQREVMRQMKAVPLLDAYGAWVEKLDPAAGNKLEDVVTYTRNQKKSLNAFLEHGEVDISNNLGDRRKVCVIDGK